MKSRFTLLERYSKSPLLIYLSILLFYLVGLSGFSIPLTGDQKVYLSIALEMKERGSWVIPYLHQSPNFLKPPFQYWATLLGWIFFGFNLFASLIPSVLAMVLSSFFVNQIYEKISKDKSLLPGLFFAGGLGTMTYATTAQMEIWIVFFYLWAWNLFLEKKFYQALLVVGVMAWVKGPLYPVLWVMSSGLWFLLENKISIFISQKYLRPVLGGVLLGMGWYALAARTELNAMLGQFLMRENVEKLHTSQGTPWGLWGEFLYSLFPWVFVLIIQGLSKCGREAFLKNKNFYLAFGLIPALFFTFFPYRVNTYLYLLTPLMCWFVMLCPVEEINPKIRKGLSTLVGVLFLALSILVTRLLLGSWISIEIGILFLLNFVLLSYFYWTWKRFPLAILSLILVSLVRMSAVQLGEKDLAGLRTYKENNPGAFAYRIEEKDIWHEFGIISVALGEPVLRLYDDTAEKQFLSQGGNVIYADSQKVPNETFCKDWVRIKKRIKFPIQKLLLEGLRADDPILTRTYRVCKKQ